MTSTIGPLPPQNVEDVICQITDWSTSFKEVDLGDESVLKYVIKIFGIAKNGQKVFVEVNEYNPYFYVKIPETWTMREVNVLLSIIKDTIKFQDSKSDEPAVANSLKRCDIVNRCIFKEFTNYKEFKFLKLTFYSHQGFKAYTRAFNKKVNNPLLSKKPQKYEAYETNVDPMLRFMHEQNLSATGMIRVSKYTKFTKENNISTDEIAISTNYANVLPIHEDKSINKIVVASFDLECTSCDGNFPQPRRDGDKIIQIGTTFNKYGEDECFLKHIITLDTCDPIEGVEVVQCATEKDLLLAWTRLIIKTNPDVITGYNIFGFDYWYLHKRAKKLGCHTAFSKLGRIKKVESPYVKKDLSSAALGKNILKYFQIEGRVNIDVMKVVQRDHKLGSYKLDNVAADFIRDEIKFLDVGENGELITKENCNDLSKSKIIENCTHSTKRIEPDKTNNTTTIYTQGIYGLEVGRVIKICFNDGLSDNSYKNDAKFKVLEIKPKSLKIDDKNVCDAIVIDGILTDEALMLDKYTIYWSQAKDDVSANDIFRMQEQGPKERSIIARYCIQDCVLVNKLINKLQILTNNIGMSNVCHVPLSYIFLRGQGIKCLSLVAKKCRERNHVIPVNKMPYVDKAKQKEENAKKTKAELKADKEAEELLYGYEGATVFDPKIGIYFDDPIAVLDYNSLYPNSMRARNLSQECKVVNKSYLNLPDCYYEDITYTNKDGTTKTCTFARPKDDKKAKGILVEILTELLDARAYTRKLQAEVEHTDPFKWKIYEGLQLAFKVTANSIYGQTGGRTSAIYDKDIAACTTATGRQMLNVARIFAELIFNKLVAIVNSGDKIGYTKFLDMLFNKQVDELIGDANVNDLKNDPKGERYSYLNIFKDNTTPAEPKFINPRLKHTCREHFDNWLYESIQKVLKGYSINTDVIYGDTDSIFINFKIRNQGRTIDGKEALGISIELGKLCSSLLHKIVPQYQNMGYEKTFYPFVILSKKRYVGNKYEFDTEHYYQNSNGIVLKRRDNAPIVKIVCGGIVRSILQDKSTEKAVAFVKETLRNIFMNKYAMEKFVISKTLKGPSMTTLERKIEQNKPKEDRYYADRTRMAHAVLADRMADRDKGSAPQSNDRVPFVYVRIEGEIEVQGDRVEHPDYIKENNLEIDYVFYITNQIMKPCIQFLELLIDKPEKLFETCIIQEMNRRLGKRPLAYYFQLIQDIERAKNGEDAFGDDEDSEEDEMDLETKTFLSQFATNFEHDTNYEEKNLVHKGTKKNIKIVKPANKVIKKPNTVATKNNAKTVKKPNAKTINRKGKGVTVTTKIVNSDGGFNL
jgi:DNA polymerase elongation subunit (family B)